MEPVNSSAKGESSALQWPGDLQLSISATERQGGVLFAYGTLCTKAAEETALKDSTGGPSDIELLAASRIKGAFRDFYTAPAYTRMFNAELFKCVGEDLPKESSPTKVYAHLKAISGKNLAQIMERVGKLDESEKLLYQTIIDTPLRFKHQTNSLVEQEQGYLHLLSNTKLHQNKIKMCEITQETSRRLLGNDDFVFFSLEVSSGGNEQQQDSRTSKDDQPIINTRHSSTFYGKSAFLLEEDHPLVQRGYLTLTDHTVGAVRMWSDDPLYSQNDPYREFRNDPHRIEDRFPDLFREITNEFVRFVHVDRKNPKTQRVYQEYRPIFCVPDMKRALALNIIDFLRSSKDETFKQYWQNNLTDRKTIDLLINSIFQPEFHIPRMVSTYDYHKKQLGEISFQEAVVTTNIVAIEKFLQEFSPERKDKELSISLKSGNFTLVRQIIDSYAPEPQREVLAKTILAQIGQYNLTAVKELADMGNVTRAALAAVIAQEYQKSREIPEEARMNVFLNILQDVNPKKAKIVKELRKLSAEKGWLEERVRQTG